MPNMIEISIPFSPLVGSSELPLLKGSELSSFDQQALPAQRKAIIFRL